MKPLKVHVKNAVDFIEQANLPEFGIKPWRVRVVGKMRSSCCKKRTT